MKSGYGKQFATDAGCSTMAGRLLTSFPTFPMLCTEISVSLDTL